MKIAIYDQKANDIDDYQLAKNISFWLEKGITPKVGEIWYGKEDLYYEVDCVYFSYKSIQIQFK